MAQKRRSKASLVRYIRSLPVGPELDRLVAIVVFNHEVEACSLSEYVYHVKGSLHFAGQVSGKTICSRPVAHFSTDWAAAIAVLEWLTENFQGVDIYYDTGTWGCNVNGQNKAGQWSRITHFSKHGGLPEIWCQAALMSQINPESLPLQIRSILDTSSTKKKPRKRKRKQ